MSAPVTVVVTRPGAAGELLAGELQRQGQPALWLPSFAFGPPPDEPAARAALASLAGFDLAVFVSPQAARATAALLPGRWPSATTIAAVGAGTRAEVMSSIAGAAAATLLAPDDDGDAGRSGSEALWSLLQAMPPPRRVLLLRAQGGRDWLAERLRERGAEVVALAVYARLPFAPDAGLRARLAAAAGAGLASVISSSDAVDALAAMLGGQPQVLGALRAGVAFASHPRIAGRLRAAGFARARLCAPDAAAIVAALREGDR